MDLKKRLLALVLAVLLILPGGVLLSPALPAAASSSGLYGTGSADEINIIRLLDMALNKGGMSMSPSTIQAFLDFWWSSVQSDLQVLLRDADTSITTASALVDHIAAAASDPANADGLEMAQLVVKFARFCVTMEFKTLDDFKQLLTQQGTFRRFLLSYVTDDQGNIAGTVDNKLAKYKLKSGFISMVRQAADVYVNDHEGYWLVPTLTYKDLSVSLFARKDVYDCYYNALKTIGDDGVFLYWVGRSGDIIDVSNLQFYGAFNDNNWSSGSRYRYYSILFIDNNWKDVNPPVINMSGLPSVDLKNYTSNNIYSKTGDKVWPAGTPLSLLQSTIYLSVFTSDGRAIKVYKSLNALKSANIGKSDIYYSKDYGTFDESKDQGLTFTGSYYSGDYSHDTIQNTIDNSQTSVDNSVVNNIVNNYITNNYGDGSGSSGGSSSGDGSGSGSGSGNDWWNIGDGITAFVKGIAALLDFLLKLLGDLITVLSDFLISLLAVLEKLAVVGSSFGDFVKAFFGFLPEECILMIMSGIGLMVVVGIIKMFKK